MDKLDRLIEILCSERGEKVPRLSNEDKFAYFRALVNVRSPKPISEEFLRLQDEYLKELLNIRGVTKLSDLTPIKPDIYLWRGDITTLKCDGIVNAANSGLLGCFCPNHRCIDNAIHTYAGVQLRLECAELMSRQGHEEQTGGAKITKAYNLPSKYVLHTVGPIAGGAPTSEHERQLKSSYFSCMRLADSHNLSSLAFCCISTGEFGFPRELAAKIAVSTVTEYKKTSNLKIIFDVFGDSDYKIYSDILGGDYA